VDIAEALVAASSKLGKQAGKLTFGAPVAAVYNPLDYAREPHQAYLRRYGQNTKRVIFFGMNPGPWGMTQTGVPFGEIAHVRDWLGITGKIKKPAHEHPQRPITGFACTRSEVSGARFWGLWKSRYRTPEQFFSWAFVSNYCPLVFMAESGANLTPDKIKASERSELLRVCDAHLASVLAALRPTWAVGVGKFAYERARAVSAGIGLDELHIACMPHPSPASPAANRDWAGAAIAALEEQGVPLDPAR
jgi:single-strand selective monofunctional uracil DNA glycosylase